MGQKKSQNTTNPTSHLNATARAWLKLTDEERIFKIQSEKWIGYDGAKEIIEKLNRLVTYPKKRRMPNLLIVGDTNNGKTMIVNRFKEQHPPDDNPDGDAKIIPVIIAQAPPTADEGRFYDLILTQLNTPFKDKDKPGRKYIQVVKICEAVGLRILIIDEIHDIIAGSRSNQRVFRSVIKQLGYDLQISIVGVGTYEAYNAIQSDDQLSNRFEPAVLPKWEISDSLPPSKDPYLKLLASFERMIPLRNQSNLVSKTMALKLLSMSDGLIGELSSILTRAAEQAIINRREKIDEVTLNEIKWIPPSERNKRLHLLR
jgi:ATP-dependent Clp protease ATP-binding subunit ClpA